MKTHIDVTQEAGKSFYLKETNGSIVMLNLLKFKKIADYSLSKTLEPENEISGEEAYQLYINNMPSFFKEAGSEILFKGKGGSFLIGPETEKWDLVLLVKHKNKKSFLDFASNPDYLKIAGHRTAALEDSRLLPIEEI